MAIALVYAALLLAGDVFSLTLAVLGGALWILLETPPPERGRRGIGPGARPARGVPARAASGPRDGAARSGDPPHHRRPLARRRPGFFDSHLAALRVLRALPDRRDLVDGRRVGLGDARRPGTSSPRSSSARSRSPGSSGGNAIRRRVGGSPGRSSPSPSCSPSRAGSFRRHGSRCRRRFRCATPRSSWSGRRSPWRSRRAWRSTGGASSGPADAGSLAVAGGLAAARRRRGPRSRGRAGVWPSPSLAAPRSSSRSRPARCPPRWRSAGLLWAATAIAADLAAGRGRAAEMVPLDSVDGGPARSPTGRSRRRRMKERSIRRRRSRGRSLAAIPPAASGPSTRRSIGRVSPLLAASMRADPAGSEVYRQSWYYFTQTIWKRGTVLNIDLDAGDLSRIESLRRLAVVAASQTDSGPFFSTLSMRYAIRFRDQDADRGVPAFRRRRVSLLGREPGRAAGHPARLALARGFGPGRRTGHAARAARRRDRRRDRREARRTRAAGEAADPRKKSGAPSPRDGSPGTDLALRPPRRLELSDRRDRRSPVETFPAQLAFTAVRVPEGAHRIEWREKAPGLEISRYGPLAGVLLLLVTARLLVLRARRAE